MLGAEVDRALLTLAKLAPDGAKEIGQARQLLTAALGKFIAAQDQVPSASPTAIGERFPGGGFGSVR